MLQELPVEVIQQITSHLPTAASIVNLSLANRKLHAIVAADDYAIFRTFVQRAFPSIKVPPLWRDSARNLTSRSRAWDRRAFIARECFPPADGNDPVQPANTGYTVGYHPVIDSYETWPDSTWRGRKEVLAWGAAGRLRMRTIKDGNASWSSFRVPDDHRSDLDILDVRLLLPHQHSNTDGESVIIRRANGEIFKVDTSSKPDHFEQKSHYVLASEDFTCLDVSRNANPILAACNGRSIHLYPVHSSERYVRAMDIVTVRDEYRQRRRKPRAKFLTNSSLAVSMQFLQGNDRAPIHVYDISPTGLSTTPLTAVISSSDSAYVPAGRHSANVLALADDREITGAQAGQLFMSGWTDGYVRIHDIRRPARPVAEYNDPVDDGQILSLLPIGNERILAGSHQNGCLKVFDLRMSGNRPYSYLDARPPQTQHLTGDISGVSPSGTRNPDPVKKVERDINIFLTPTVNRGERLWQPLPRHPGRRSERYRGSVYSLSSPSPSSPTVYAGIANHVIQLDFVATDDARSTIPDLVDPALGLNDVENYILNLSCYERPRRGFESTDPVLLRNQQSLQLKGGAEQQADPVGNPYAYTEDGWDSRWLLHKSGRVGSRPDDWRGGRRQ